MPTRFKRLVLFLVGLILLSAATAQPLETTSMLLLGTGLIGVAGVARRKLKVRK